MSWGEGEYVKRHGNSEKRYTLICISNDDDINKVNMDHISSAILNHLIFKAPQRDDRGIFTPITIRNGFLSI